MGQKWLRRLSPGLGVMLAVAFPLSRAGGSMGIEAALVTPAGTGSSPAALDPQAVAVVDQAEAALAGRSPEKLDEPFGVGFNKAGNMFIIEITGRLLKADAKGGVTTVAGASKKGYEGINVTLLESGHIELREGFRFNAKCLC